MTTPDQEKLLQALAAGGKAAGDQYLAAQEANKASQADAIKAALAHSAGLGIEGEAQGVLRGIINQPYASANTYSKATADAFQRNNYDRLMSTNEWANNNTQINEDFRKQAEKELLDKVNAMFTGGRQVEAGAAVVVVEEAVPVVEAAAAVVAAQEKASDWVAQLRSDLGIVGSGIRTKSKDVEAMLRKLSLEGVPKGSETDRLPRNLREREYLKANYGAPDEELDKAAPIVGFLKAANEALDLFREGKLTDDANDGKRIRDAAQFAAYIRRNARHLKGDQSRAVQYVLAQMPRPQVGNIAVQNKAPVPQPVQKAVAKIVNGFW